LNIIRVSLSPEAFTPNSQKKDGVRGIPSPAFLRLLLRIPIGEAGFPGMKRPARLEARRPAVAAAGQTCPTFVQPQREFSIQPAITDAFSDAAPYGD
jgi:hypothetical protein